MPNRFRVLGGIVSLCLLCLSCKKEDTAGSSPQIPEPFKVSITVRTTAGQPVQGLRISAWNKLPFAGLPAGDTRESPQGSLPVTIVGFQVGMTARIQLLLLEMNGSLHSTVWSDTLSQGNYRANISVTEHVPTRVFKCRLIARALNIDSIVFTDSIYAVLHQPDPSISTLGWTNQDGMFQTTDTLLFPNVLKLPPMVRTNANGPQPLGMFAIPDSVVITLTDTTVGQAQTFTRLVRKGSNNIELVWSPGPSSAPSLLRSAAIDRASERLLQRLSTIAAQWELDQNFPNPFN